MHRSPGFGVDIMVFKKKKKKEEKKVSQDPEFKNPIKQVFSPGVDLNPITDSERLINAWLDKEKIHMKTSLSQNQVNSISILMSLADQWKVEPLEHLLLQFITYSISKDSNSAKQLVDILQNKGIIGSQDIDAINKFSR